MMRDFRKEISNWYDEWKIDLKLSKYKIIISLLFIMFSTIICFYASTYVDSANTTPVNDIILDNIPVVNLDLLFSYGFISVLMLVTIYTLLFNIKKFHEVAIAFGLLIIVRSIFITMTHLGLPVGARIDENYPELFKSLFFRNDLFFSGHVAMSFMAFLIYRKDLIGKFFFIMTIVLGATVLFEHLHYSIDVFSAFFITYGIYQITEWLIRTNFWKTITHSR